MRVCPHPTLSGGERDTTPNLLLTHNTPISHSFWGFSPRNLGIFVHFLIRGIPHGQAVEPRVKLKHLWPVGPFSSVLGACPLCPKGPWLLASHLPTAFCCKSQVLTQVHPPPYTACLDDNSLLYGLLSSRPVLHTGIGVIFLKDKLDWVISCFRPSSSSPLFSGHSVGCHVHLAWLQSASTGFSTAHLPPTLSLFQTYMTCTCALAGLSSPRPTCYTSTLSWMTFLTLQESASPVLHAAFPEFTPPLP